MRISIFPFDPIRKNSTIGKEFVAKNRFIPNTKWLDYFNLGNPKGILEYIESEYVRLWVDSWWMDAVEPENDALKGEKRTLVPEIFPFDLSFNGESGGVRRTARNVDR